VKAITLALALTGCAQVVQVPQPRALLTPPVNPSCIWWCIAEISLVDSEGAAIHGAAGAVSIAKPITSSQSSQVNVSETDTLSTGK
jgi:hypothetical protein